MKLNKADFIIDSLRDFSYYDLFDVLSRDDLCELLDFLSVFVLRDPSLFNSFKLNVYDYFGGDYIYYD